MNDFVAWLNANAGALGILIAVTVAVLPPAWAFFHYLNLRSKELQHDRFKIYHDLVRALVQPEAAGGEMSLDRQIAIVYEMRHFPEYFELTARMLQGLLKSWDKPHNARLAEEIRFTLEYIADRSKGTVSRDSVA